MQPRRFDPDSSENLCGLRYPSLNHFVGDASMCVHAKSDLERIETFPWGCACWKKRRNLRKEQEGQVDNDELSD
jgi:hypothetical protein